MLVTRQLDAEQNPWSIHKRETIFHKSKTSIPRMSNNYDVPLPTQSDWQGQYSFLPPGDSVIFSQSYDNGDPQAQPRSADTTSPLDMVPKAEPGALNSPFGHRRSLDPPGLRPPKPPTPIQEQPGGRGDLYSHKPGGVPQDEPLGLTDTGLVSQALGSLPAGRESDLPPTQPEDDDQMEMKEEEEEMVDAEEMAEGDAEAQPQPQTAAERTAQRRKMKRFRLTHQQTRFLMSEFAKQPHPDAAHRERLSQEIPGLSPRQVQVWFQNRRAKIKRLTADDRDRMIKMRAVPDDFDNVQALHSPYGAVHALGTPLASPVDFGAPSYGEHLMRPLMVDVRRPEGDDHPSPTSLTPGFGGSGFNQLSSPDILSPLSPTSNDRYGYSGHLPLSAGPRTSNPFVRQNSLDAGMQIHNHRQSVRPLQPLQLRDTMSRTRADSLQSSLRTSMSWKGQSLNYTTYHESGSPPLGRPQSVYQAEGLGGTSTALAGYEANTYPGSTVQSPTHLNYPTFQSSLQRSQSRSRLRAASATLPLGLDLRYRSLNTGQPIGPAGHSSPTHRSSSISGVSSSYNAGGGNYASAPLTAPIDFSLSRTSGAYRTSTQDYAIPQMSAPIAPPGDFAQAFQASMTGPASSRTPMRDSFGEAGGGAEDHHRGGGDDYATEGLSAGVKKKLSFNMTQGRPSSGSGSAYGRMT